MAHIALLALLAFVSTNLDDIFLLVGFFSRQGYAASHIVVGQYLGIGTLVLISTIAAVCALTIAPAYVGLLGFLPIFIGAKKLRDAWRGQNDDSHTTVTGTVLSVASVTIANGGDNIGIYTPLFASMDVSQWAATVTVFAIMTAVWCASAHLLVHHKRFGAYIHHWGNRLLPFVLIALGISIVWNSGALTLLRF